MTATVRGKPEAVRLALVALLSGGHLLVEDLPGTGKTLLAKTLAAAIGGRFGRVQCTPDLLPTDITGTSVFVPATGTWDFRPGPLFANVVLLDEVNRASPRTQAALLEPMEEHQVTVDGATRAAARSVLLRRDPEPVRPGRHVPVAREPARPLRAGAHHGSARTATAEREILTGVGGADAFPTVTPVTTPAEVAVAIDAMRRVHCAPGVIEYVLDLAAATRSHPDLSVGASPRASVGLLKRPGPTPWSTGRDFVTPDDVQGGRDRRVRPPRLAGQRRRHRDAAQCWPASSDRFRCLDHDRTRRTTGA